MAGRRRGQPGAAGGGLATVRLEGAVVRVAVAAVAVLAVLIGAGLPLPPPVHSAPTPTPDAALRAHVAALLRLQRQILLAEIDRPEEDSDTWIEPKIVRVPPGGRPLPDPAEAVGEGPPAPLTAPQNRRLSDPRGDGSPGSTQSETSLATWHGLMLGAWNDG